MSGICSCDVFAADVCLPCRLLRPKVHDYTLTVEKGDGYHLDRSLLERLVLQGHPYKSLQTQHLLRAEIASYVRRLRHPGLIDADTARNRPDLRGAQANVMFIAHAHPESEHSRLIDACGAESRLSRTNVFEADMAARLLRYLEQNGYGTDRVVVLTPCLGQLHVLHKALRKGGFEPALNELDLSDLIAAGLVPRRVLKPVARRVRLATVGKQTDSDFLTPVSYSKIYLIDNYQDAASDIVLVSLTRSNDVFDIGSMAAPERLNTLLACARDALILLGNAETFRGSSDSSWAHLVGMLREDGRVYNGFPAKCCQHPDRQQLLKCPQDFDDRCPEGGCSEPW